MLTIFTASNTMPRSTKKEEILDERIDSKMVRLARLDRGT